jgi:hypothetical protein
MPAHPGSRSVALLVVVALHGLLLLVLRDALSRAARTPRRDLALVWLNLAPSRTVESAPRFEIDTPERSLAPRRGPRVAATPARAPPDAGPSPDAGATPLPLSPIDWTAEAFLAARASLDNTARERRERTAMGVAPHTSSGKPAVRPQFPWSRQPKGGIVDFDPNTFVLTLKLKRCQVSYLLIVAGFGCDLGPKDPEPGRSDLFDAKYAPQPLELPQSALEPAPGNR